MKMLLLTILCTICELIVAQKNIVDLATDLGATELVQFVKDAGLTDTLTGSGPFTVFAPTNEAFNALPTEVVEKLKNDKELLATVLKYHVVSGTTYSTALKNDMVVDTIDKAEKLRINIYGTTSKIYTVNGAVIVKVDQGASNGVIHVINKVLYPIPTQSIVQLVGTDPSFSTLLYCVVRAQLDKTLQGGPFTVFAPTDAAFNKLPVGALSDLLSNQTALIDVLTYHVISGTIYSAGINVLNGTQVEAVDKKLLTFKVDDNGVMVDSSKVTTADVSVTNGVVHAIDKVLLPPKY